MQRVKNQVEVPCRTESGIGRAYSGKGVAVAVLDTGIRYQEGVFRDAAGNSRILAIWDQTIQTGRLPEGFEYGSEYTNEDINKALRSDNPLSIVPSTDANGHGSTAAAVAAGSPIENGSFIGAAPDAQIVMVKLKEGASARMRGDL